MTLLEGTILIILLLLAMPGLCRRVGRPGLLYPSYIIAGGLAGLFMTDTVTETWRQIGQLGFILLLFSVGLEIELPEKKASFVALRRAVGWMMPQVALVVGVLMLVGAAPLESTVSAIALSSTSVGMAYVLWSHHKFVSLQSGKTFLEWLVAIEVVAIMFLAAVGPVLEGVVWWLGILRFAGLFIAAGLAVVIALRIVPRIAREVSNGLKIEVPLLVLVIFSICALGDRLGLSAPKTAFVLGLFISRSTDEEVALNHRLEPLRDRLFVPVFFFGLGTLLRWETVASWQFLAALGAGVVMFGVRRLLFQLMFASRFQTSAAAHTMAAPMLTLAAVAVEVLVHAKASPDLISWTLAASLSLTLCAAFGAHTPHHLLVDFEPTMAAPEALKELATDRSEPEKR